MHTFGPYKDKCYFWTGLLYTSVKSCSYVHVFLGLSTLDNDTNLNKWNPGNFIGVLLRSYMYMFKVCGYTSFQELVENAHCLLVLYITTLYNNSNSQQEFPIACIWFFHAVLFNLLYLSVVTF